MLNVKCQMSFDAPADPLPPPRSRADLNIIADPFS